MNKEFCFRFQILKITGGVLLSHFWTECLSFLWDEHAVSVAFAAQVCLKNTTHLGSNEIWPLASQEADKPCFGLDTFFLSSFRVKTIRSPAALTWSTDKKINKCKHLPVRVGTMSIFMSGSLPRASSSQGLRQHYRHNSHTLLNEFHLPGKRPKKNETVRPCPCVTWTETPQLLKICFVHSLTVQPQISALRLQYLNQGLSRISPCWCISDTIPFERKEKRYELKGIKLEPL